MLGKSIGLAAVSCLLLAGTAFAGDNNTLHLTQTGDGGSLANSFYADQSHSVGNTIMATQNGSGNVAHIVTSDLCSAGLATPCGGRVDLTQDNAHAETSASPFSAGGELARNYVSVTTAGNSTAAVTQQGDGNSATLDIRDGNGEVDQQGDDNTASLTVEDGTSGTITQNNGHNSAALEVSGVRGASATLTQNGGRSYSGPVVVNTLSPLPVVVTQN